MRSEETVGIQIFLSNEVNYVYIKMKCKRSASNASLIISKDVSAGISDLVASTSVTSVSNVFKPINICFRFSRKLLKLTTHKFAQTQFRKVLFIGNDVITYFRSAANCINVFILGHVRVAISR